MLEPVLWLLTAQGLLGAFDTVYFHELRARLPALQGGARPECWRCIRRDRLSMGFSS